MAEGVETADGTPVSLDTAPPEDVERQFAQAMSAPADDDKTVPPKRAQRTTTPQVTSKPRTGKARTAPAGQPAARVPSEQDIVQGVEGLIQIPAALCLMLSRRAADPVPLQADAVTLAAAAPDIARACAATAAADPKFAALMGKVTHAGPYAALMTVAFSVGSQIARNHGVITLPGTTDPRVLVEAATTPQEAHAGSPAKG